VVIDAHLHLWDTSRYRYEWLLRPRHESINRTYTFSDFAVRAAAAGVDRAVLVQAADDDTDTEAMFEVADVHDEIAGVVGWVPLDRPDVAAASLGRLRARPKFSALLDIIGELPAPRREAILAGTARDFYGL
jgi:L-fuconolactonase